MYQTAGSWTDTPEVEHHGWISGRGWQFKPGDDGCGDCYVKECRNGRRPPEAETCVSYKEESGGRRMICFIFLVLGLIFLCAWAGVLPLDLLACAVGMA